MKFSTVTEEQLSVLQQGLDLIGHVSADLLPTTLYLYGLIKPESPIMADVNEAAWEDNYAGEVRPENLQIKTAAVSVRLSGDILAAILGSGLRSDDDEFQYILKNESHSSSFAYSQTKPTLSIGQFSKVALADDSYWLKDFLQAEGTVQEQQNPSVVTRTDQATGEHGGAAEALHQNHKHQSALKGSKKWDAVQIRSLVEGFLGDTK